MELEACPLCQAIKSDPDSAFGDHCVKVKYRTVELASGIEVEKLRPAVVLADHESKPSPAAVAEAMTMLGSRSGVVEDIRDVAGHWGVYVKDGDWSAAGKSSAYDTER